VPWVLKFTIPIIDRGLHLQRYLCLTSLRIHGSVERASKIIVPESESSDSDILTLITLIKDVMF